MTQPETPQPELEDGAMAPIEYIRHASSLIRTPSIDGSVNRDSLLYLARFALGEATNLFHVSGAIRCSGSTTDQLARIVDLLASASTRSFVADAFVDGVEETLSISVRSIQQFPAPPREPTAEDAVHAREFDETMQAQARAHRKQAEEDETLDQAIAELQGVLVLKASHEWGWNREDTGERYSPSSDPALAFTLVEQYHLNIGFHAGDVVVTFHVSQYDHGSHCLYKSKCGGSLTRTVAIAAYRKALLERRVR
jgi:hypothetical protein